MLEQHIRVPVYLHIISDGRDTDPHSAVHFVTEMQEFLKDKRTKIASLIGRYFAMDRDKRWERIRKAYDLYVLGKGTKVDNAIEAIEQSYAAGITDEFIEPFRILDTPDGCIKNGDAVLCINFRTDRLRQLTQVLSQTDFEEYEMKNCSCIMLPWPDTMNLLKRSLYYLIKQMFEIPLEKCFHVMVVPRYGLQKLKNIPMSVFLFRRP